jgi:uncharacterized Zn finger protein
MCSKLVSFTASLLYPQDIGYSIESKNQVKSVSNSTEPANYTVLISQYDSDSLPEFALKKKERWSMNSKQLARYIKRRMGNNLKRQILQREGIELDDGSAKPKPAIMSCPRCSETNPKENKFCST